MRMNRRKVLQATALGVSTTGIGLVSASRDPNFVGYAYNPRTHEVIDEITADLKVGEKAVSGRVYAAEEIVETGDDVINIDNAGITEDNIEEDNVRRYRSKKKEDTIDGEVISPSMKIISDLKNGTLTGYIQGSDNERVAFLVEENNNRGLTTHSSGTDLVKIIEPEV